MNTSPKIHVGNFIAKPGETYDFTEVTGTLDASGAPPAKTAAQIFAELEAEMEQVTQKHITALHLAFAKAEAAHKTA